LNHTKIQETLCDRRPWESLKVGTHRNIGGEPTALDKVGAEGKVFRKTMREANHPIHHLSRDGGSLTGILGGDIIEVGP
jgi:hypothetical protein